MLCLFAAWGWATEEREGVSLSCLPSEDGKRLPCIVSGDYKDTIWLLMSPFALEGPLGGSNCKHFYVGGERVENTLEYGFPQVGRLGGPILFKPVAQIGDSALNMLLRVDPATEVRFSISLEDVPQEYFANSAEWIFRAKIVFVMTSALSDLISTGQLDRECSARIREVLASRPSKGKDAEVATRLRLPYESAWHSDGCFDRITEEFEAVYSEDVLLAVADAGKRSHRGRDTVCTSDLFFKKVQ